MTQCICDPGYGMCMYSQDGKCLSYGGIPYKKPMSEYSFLVTVTTDSEVDAHTVMTERLCHDEEYGFPYTVECKQVNGELKISKINE